jgi:diadenosine tetraphosphatase ApaH/serine/threonine PP2A family protein phosphatase
MPQSEVGSYYETFQEDILITGHTHRPYIKKIKNSLLVNPGSVGGQRDGDPRASFAVFDTRTGQIELGRVEYDTSETINLLKKLNYPNYALFCLKTGFLSEDPYEVFEEEVK